MKKIAFFVAFALCAILSNAATYNYLCGITELKVDTLQSTTKNQFTITFHQKCKNTAEYGKAETFYESDIKIVLNSDDRTLDGVYTTEGADRQKSSANVNDQTINMITTELTFGNTSRILYKDESYVSTFVIGKNENGEYYIGECTLYFSQRLEQTNIYIYNYSYDADEILNQGITQTPYVFNYSGEYVSETHSYDLTVNELDIVYSESDYGHPRYFLTMQCTGVERETNDERQYEVQLAIYPSNESIVGHYATQESPFVLFSQECYVKDLKKNKQRNLANDSISSVTIKSNGANKYNFVGGPLICTDVDLNHQAVYGEKRIEATHYYYFNSNNGGNGIDFIFDGENASLDPAVPTSIDALNATDNASCRKIFRNGEILILKDGQTYSVTGQIRK